MTDDSSWFEKASSVRIIAIALVLASVVLVLAEFAYEHHHPHFEVETFFGFQAWLGFAAFVAVVLMGRLVRPLLSRPEDFYDDTLPTIASANRAVPNSDINGLDTNVSDTDAMAAEVSHDG